MTLDAMELATSPVPALAVLMPSHTTSIESGPLLLTNRASWLVWVSRTFMRPMWLS
ncbi:MAG: hypothetical protein H6736_10165 [Alphaproteobacteria bacterium]|nr:hypothetical protein [Alphaproteobacteria bacterium]